MAQALQSAGVMMRSPAFGDLGVAVVAIAVAALAFANLPGGFAMRPWAALAHIQSPAFFPTLIGSVAILLALVHGLAAWRGALPPPDDGRVEAPVRLLAALVTLVAFGFATWAVGMLPASIAAVAVLAAVLGARRWWVVALVAVIVPCVIWLLFRRGLMILLPEGVWL